MSKKNHPRHPRLVSVRDRHGDELLPAPLMRDCLGLSQRQHQATREMTSRNVTPITPVLTLREPPKLGFWARLALVWANLRKPT